MSKSQLILMLFVSCLSLSVNGQTKQAKIVPVKTELSQAERQMVDWVSQQQDAILSDLRTHVEINTGTANINGLNAYRNLLMNELESMGFTLELHSSPVMQVLSCGGGEVAVADHLVARKSQSSNTKSRVLINGHMDTVFSADDEFQTLTIEADGTLKGPGVADMKGGIVIMLYALKALDAAGRLDDVNLTVLFNSDEEIGSLGSRELIETLAKQHDVGLVFEGSHDNLVTRSRKGLGQARLKVTGRESHAGGAHADGVSANIELAHKIINIEKLTNYENKVTVNTGVMQGGEKRNTIPGCADAYIDLRYPSAKRGAELQKGIDKVAAKKYTANRKYPDFPKTQSWSILHRPVKPVNSEVDSLIAQAMGLSQIQVIGEPIMGTNYSGGGTDGSIAQGVGLPTMDSIGIDGKGAHSSREQASVKSLYARTKLAAVLLGRLIEQPAAK